MGTKVATGLKERADGVDGGGREWVDGTSPLGEGVAQGTLDGEDFVDAAPVVPYTTGETIDVNLDLTLQLADGSLQGEAAFIDDATCTFERP